MSRCEPVLYMLFNLCQLRYCAGSSPLAFLTLLSGATKRSAGHAGSVINISSMSGITRTS